MAKMQYNRLKAIIAEAQSIVDEFDANRAAESGDAPARPVGGMDSAPSHEREMQEHYANMEKIAGPHASRIWKSRR